MGEKKNKVLITGYSGMLGKDITRIMAESGIFELYGTSRSEKGDIPGIRHIAAELTDHNSLKKLLKIIDPDIIVHTAACVDVDACEKNKEYAYAINSAAAEVLSGYDPEATRFVYVSTDSIFDGNKGDYSETDEPGPMNYYALSKLEGERLSLRNNPNTIAVRTNIYGFHQGKGKSLAEWAIQNLSEGNTIKGFTDVYFNPVYTKQLARIITELITEIGHKGIINIGSTEYVSKYEFLQLLAESFGFDRTKIMPDSVLNTNFIAKRPQNTTLNIKLMEKLISSNTNLRDGLKELRNDFYNR